MTVDDGALRTSDQRPDHRVRLAGIADLQALGDLGEAFAERIEDRFLDENSGVGHADLALVKEDTESRRLDGIVDVGIAKHDQRALAAHFQRELL